MLPNGFFMRYVVIQRDMCSFLTRDMFAMLTRYDINPHFRAAMAAYHTRRVYHAASAVYRKSRQGFISLRCISKGIHRYRVALFLLILNMFFIKFRR